MSSSSKHANKKRKLSKVKGKTHRERDADVEIFWNQEVAGEMGPEGADRRINALPPDLTL